MMNGDSLDGLTEHEKKHFSDHMHFLKLIDKGTYFAENNFQMIYCSYLPKREGMPSKFNISIKADVSRFSDVPPLSFRSDNAEKLEKFIVRLCRILFTMHEPLKRDNPMQFLDFVDDLIFKIKNQVKYVGVLSSDSRTRE